MLGHPLFQNTLLEKGWALGNLHSEYQLLHDHGQVIQFPWDSYIKEADFVTERSKFSSTSAALCSIKSKSQVGRRSLNWALITMGSCNTGDP